MHNDRIINVELIDIGHRGPTTLSWPLKDIEFVEQLIYSILETKKVGPVYRQLFGIKVTNRPDVWLAPNANLQKLLDGGLGATPGTLELRMRFRPSSYTKLLVLDKEAFEIIFSQLRYDFLHTKFSTERKDYILLNDSVLGLIATDLIRHALENDIPADEIFKRVKLIEFIPRNSAKWQRPLLFHLRKKFNLPKSIQIGFRCCDKNILKVKQAFIELFLYDVCQDYGSEKYRVLCVDDPNNPYEMDIRVRYNQTPKDSECIIEGSSVSPSSHREWTKLCDIYSICYGALRDDTIEIDRLNGRLFRVKFRSSLEAHSFLSLIDGYYRLMRKWNFNFCRDVLSPDLEHLKSIKSHGPIGLESMRLKLTSIKKPGTFLVRRCMEINNRYLIDVLLQTKVRLTIDIQWHCEKRTYFMIGHSSNRDIKTSIYVDQVDYKDLKTLISDIQIKVGEEEEKCPPLQLKHWLPPSEHDDCPALLLSIPKTKFKEFDEKENRISKSLAELPKLFPPEMIHPSGKIIQKPYNKMIVRVANLNGEQSVIVKEHVPEGFYTPDYDYQNLVIYQHAGIRDRVKFFIKLKPAQFRLTDWIFVKNSLFAETIGLDLGRNSLIQEYLPLGPLDKYLSKNHNITSMTFRSISCQLASALLFLQERRIIHGKIRCHNILLKNLDPLEIKLTDPLGTFDAQKDLAFLPPGYSGLMLKKRSESSGRLCVKEYEPGIDVWAFGTTLWQVYSKGIRPPPNAFSNELVQPSTCPDAMWRLIEACWVDEPLYRASPQTIFRDLNDAFAWEVRPHDYDYISGGPKSNLPCDGHHACNNEPPYDMGASNTTSVASTAANTSQIGLISKTTSKSPNGFREQSRAAPKIPKNMRDGYNKKPVVKPWRLLFKSTPHNANDTQVTTDYSEYRNDSTISSKKSISNCSTTSGSDDTKVTEIVDSNHAKEMNSIMRIDPTRLKLCSEIGRGSCGVVIKGILSQWGDLSERVVAVKCINKDSNDVSQIEDLKREFEILKNLDHKNIVKTLGFVDNTTMMLVVEYMPLGSLLSCLKNSRHDDLSNLPLQKYAYDIARGMGYLESMKIVHRDLALRNILVKNHNEVKICDFGLAQYLDSNNHYKLKTDRALPLKWYAPEVLSTWVFSHKTDVWSYGIVLWEIYSGGSNPQYSGTYADLTETLKHERLLMPKGCPLTMYQLMLNCWAYDPDERRNFPEICEQLQGADELSGTLEGDH